MSLDALDTTERVIAYCRQNNLIEGAQTDIEELIRRTPNLELVKKPLRDGIDAYIREIEPQKYEIGVNSKHSLTRQRFSMAHEFAHFQLHRKNLKELEEGERILHRSDERNLIEWQANSFAAEILMPEDQFREEIERTRGNISEIAERFGVSELALRYRAKNLGMRGHGV
ncbi:ImmA/IrrE family metallo-endopeptidase [Phaeobacter inhibens]|uniref:ImmA/IrrE family metallo-endopeptidase n=1 Tax=Phaeobacter inhibens TaxID=221822 RepID=UPI0018DC5DA6|nr:ImmA/IrrE family metallo-endopeptidase [Phaeobacter inhibens]